jgi:hypothetical protein
MVSVSLQQAPVLAGNRLTKLNYLFNDVVGRLQDHEFLASRQSYDGIRRNFDMFDKVGVDDQWAMIQPRKVYQSFTPVNVARRYIV